MDFYEALTGQPRSYNSWDKLYGSGSLLNRPQNASQLVGWNEGSYLQKLQEMADKGDPGAIDKLVNYYMTEASEKRARDWTAQREDSAYSRLMEDLRKVGISPYVLSGATPMVSNATAKSYSGTQMTSEKNSEKNRNADIGKAIGSILASIGTALLFALL